MKRLIDKVGLIRSIAALLIVFFANVNPPSSKELANKLQPKGMPTGSNCVLRMGWGIWPPYQYLTEKNTAKGSQIELFNKIAKQANCKLEYHQQSFSQSLNDIKDGNIDIMADTTVTAERSGFASFSQPYRHEILVLYVRQQDANICKDKSLLDIMSSNFKLGVTKGNLYGAEFETIRNKPEFAGNIVYLAENNLLTEALIEQQIDGFFEDPAVEAYELKIRNLRGQIKACRIEIYAGDVSLMFSQKTVSADIIERFNRSITSIKRSKWYKTNWQW